VSLQFEKLISSILRAVPNQGPALSQASVKLDPFDSADGFDFGVPLLLSMVISSTLPPNEPMGPLTPPTIASQVPDTDV